MKIDNRKYSGYVWMSDDNIPEKVLHEEDYTIEKEDQANPFVIEAQLYCAEERLSISVKHVDGKYIIKEYTNVGPDTANEDDIELKIFKANPKIGGMLQFLQYWEEKKDDEVLPTREGMVELRPSKLVFVGFKK